MNIGTLIRDVRTSRGETMAEFASHLGLRHTAISRYEAGKLEPSASVLLNVFRLATDPQQKSSIRAHLGTHAAVLDKENKFELAGANLLAELESVKRDLQQADRAYARFTLLATSVVGDPDGVPLWLCDLMEMWLDVKGRPHLRRAFDDLVHDAAMRIRHLHRKDETPAK